LKILRRLTLFLIAIPILLVGLEAFYFIWVLNGKTAVQKADVIIVFEGMPERVKAAYRLLDQAYASKLVISPATEQKLYSYDKKYLPTVTFARILEDKARTTFENALHTHKIITENGFRSAILVTSWDHMPRSLFLMQLTITGSEVQVRPHAVATGKLDQTKWFRHSVGWKMVYNEMVEFWGSMLEFARYGLSGELPREVPGKSGLADLLRKVLLFQIDDRATQG
jgi:uncharacterized SAM-binding protein YcdF (DUF218 family)